MARIENKYARFYNMSSGDFTKWKNSMLRTGGSKAERQRTIERINDIADMFDYKGFKPVTNKQAQSYVSGASKTVSVGSAITKVKTANNTNSPAPAQRNVAAVNNNTERSSNMAARRNQTRLERAAASSGGSVLGYGTSSSGSQYVRVRTAGGRTMNVPVPAGSSDK